MYTEKARSTSQGGEATHHPISFIFVYFSSFLFSAVRSLSRRMGRRLILEKKLTQTKSTVSVMRLCIINLKKPEYSMYSGD